MWGDIKKKFLKKDENVESSKTPADDSKKDNAFLMRIKGLDEVLNVMLGKAELLSRGDDQGLKSEILSLKEQYLDYISSLERDIKYAKEIQDRTALLEGLSGLNTKYDKFLATYKKINKGYRDVRIYDDISYKIKQLKEIEEKVRDLLNLKKYQEACSNITRIIKTYRSLMVDFPSKETEFTSKVSFWEQELRKHELKDILQRASDNIEQARNFGKKNPNSGIVFLNIARDLIEKVKSALAPELEELFKEILASKEREIENLHSTFSSSLPGRSTLDEEQGVLVEIEKVFDATSLEDSFTNAPLQGIVSESNVKVYRGGAWSVIGNQSIFRYKVKVFNNSPSVITNLNVVLMRIPTGLELYSSKIVDFPVLNPGAMVSPEFELKAKKSCVGDVIEGIVTFSDAFGKLVTLKIKPLMIEYKCNLLVASHVSDPEFETKTR
ncbi:MAG: hypothetical protein ACTSYS_02620, partial [Promethearchaeota archaeon]